MHAPSHSQNLSSPIRPRCNTHAFVRVLLAVLAFALFTCPSSNAYAGSNTSPALATLNLTQYVNPFIGTDYSPPPNSEPGGEYPGAVVPFGMVQFSPDTPRGSPSGYRYGDNTIEEFSLTHFNGGGCANNEDLGILPITGALDRSPGTHWTNYSAGYLKSNESASPGYYKNRLERYGIDVELTATTRTGMARFTFPATNQATVLINTSRNATGNREGSININGNQLTGDFTAGGFCSSTKTYKLYFAIEFDQTPIDFGTWFAFSIAPGSTSARGVDTGGYLTFDTTINPIVQMKIGLSYVSIANAQQNLVTENPAWSFSTVQSNANTAWNTILNRVQVSGGTTDDLTKFYTALYRVLSSPNVASDVNGQYMGFDYVAHTASGMTVYQNFSGWDVYRSWAALLAMIAPNEMTDIVKSMILDGQQGGLLPKWSQQNQEHFIMNGDPGPIIVSSAYAFGVRNFDTAAALILMNKSGSQVDATTQGRAIRDNLSQYLALHYIPDNASWALEYSISDFAIAQFAKALGDTAKYEYFMNHAQWWISEFGAESSYLHTRNTDGSFRWPLDPASPTGYTEGNAAQYTFMVPHNYASLINLMGGKLTATQRLDHLFTQVKGGYLQPYFHIANEPGHNQPWAYHFTGTPWGTQSAVRRILTETFSNAPGGLPGNDDLGATSAFYVWGALGMFPIIPGTDTLALHGPLFTSATIQLADGKTLQINGSGAGTNSQYIQSLRVNSIPTTRTWVRFSEIANGATFDFTMGNSPNKNWGIQPSDEPPSFVDGFTPPSTPPNWGSNLALNKPATSDSVCVSAENPAKAVDGILMNNSKWCSLGAVKWLKVDLGSNYVVSNFIIKHAGLGGETTGSNTGGFNIQLSTDDITWSSSVLNVAGNRSSRTTHAIVPTLARYVKLNITTPANNGNNAARIYEFEIYSVGGTPSNNYFLPMIKRSH